MNFKNLNFDQLYSDAKSLKLYANDSYIESYPEFIRYFEDIDKLTRHHLIIGSHFVYGWMPTIIKVETTEVDRVLFLLNAAKCGHNLNLDEYGVLKTCVNNSMVGLSKLLHFMRPSDYAIWDSRVCSYIMGKKSYQSIISNENNYAEYLDKLKELSRHEKYSLLHTLVTQGLGYEVSPLRAMEIIMFETDRKGRSSDSLDRFVYTSNQGLSIIK